MESYVFGNSCGTDPFLHRLLCPAPFQAFEHKTFFLGTVPDQFQSFIAYRDDVFRLGLLGDGIDVYKRQIVHITKLNSQFRCNGSNGYLNWLDNTLQIKETANIRLIAKDYDFQIFSDPNQLFEAIKEKNKINNKARVVAGYCWDWNSKKIPSDYDIIPVSYTHLPLNEK